jgi:signal transduction histidine kinase
VPITLGRLRAGHWIAIDVAAAVLLTYRSLALPWETVVVLVVEVAAVLPVAVRRLWPVSSFAVVLAASFASTLLRPVPFPYVALALVLYTVAVRFPLRRSLVALGVALVTIVASAELGGAVEERAAVTTSRLTIVGMALAIGVAVRQQAAHAAVQREQAVTEERIRIARELHDVVAHGMSLIALQAGVARYVAATQPDEAARTLATIEQTSRAGLREMRQLLSTLRTDDQPGTDPAPGLADLDALVTRTRDAGVPVAVESRGAARSLPPGVDLSAYRIVQEALTNVIKHAGPARVEVVLDYRPDALRIEVTDDGRRAPAGRPAGHGILGMRERVAVFGGSLSAGPLEAPRHGFRVSAVLPTPEEAR